MLLLGLEVLVAADIVKTIAHELTFIGLGLLATDNSIPALIGIFREDPSPGVREMAACSIAQSGMFTESQRMRAVPDLLKMMDDATLDATTRSWVFQALRDITGAGIGSDPATWRAWWSQRPHA